MIKVKMIEIKIGLWKLKPIFIYDWISKTICTKCIENLDIAFKPFCESTSYKYDAYRGVSGGEGKNRTAIINFIMVFQLLKYEVYLQAFRL